MNYKKSRDVVWRLLIKHKISSLPVNLSQICKAEHIKLFTYQEGEDLIRKLQLREHEAENDAFSIGRVIFYNSENIIARQRFSIAHEMGHIFLHSCQGATVYNRESTPSDNPLEAEANVFASRLLAPLCVLHDLNVQSAKDISELCNISIAAAQIRFNRLSEIRERDNAFRRTKGHGCFLLSPHERAVYKRFIPFIETHRKN